MSQPMLSHLSVLKDEVLTAMQPKSGEVYVDATFGAGGYTRALLKAADCRLFGIDRDPHAKAFARLIEQDFPERFMLLEGRFSEMESLLAAYGVEAVNGIVLDIGVSSMQLDDAGRGFSFRFDGPLDMRMGQDGQTAADFINTADEAEIANVLYNYGEEKASRRIAKVIVAERKEQPFERTQQLADLIRRVVGGGAYRIDPCTRSFQALRIFINDELGELESALEAAERLLVPGGRLVIVTFHSLEDRIVKRFFEDRSGKTPGVSRYAPEVKQAAPTFELLYRKPVLPTDTECDQNSRARSAKLRAGIRTHAPARRNAL